MPYSFTQHEILTLLYRIHKLDMWVPRGFYLTGTETLQSCYNGVGPEQWAPAVRKWLSWLLSFLEAAAMIHDWEYTFAPRTYSAFTLANVRLAWNTWKEGEFTAGVCAGLLCQLFGWYAFRNAHNRMPPSAVLLLRRAALANH